MSARPTVIPPNAKYQPQEPHFVTNDTSSRDPFLMRSRLYIGNTTFGRMSREDLIELFSMYGPLTALTYFTRQGYGFVQFEQEEDAGDALSNLHNYIYKGAKLDVRAITPKGQPSAFNQNAHCSANGFGGITFQRQTKGRGRRGGRRERERKFRKHLQDQGFTAEEIDKIVEEDQDDDDGERQYTTPFESEKPADEPSVPATDTVTHPTKKNAPPPHGAVLNENEIPDLFVCGGCRLITANAQFFVEHRLGPCDRKPVVKGEDEPENLKCHTCKLACRNSWDLIGHMAQVHKLNLFNMKKDRTVEHPSDM